MPQSFPRTVCFAGPLGPLGPNVLPLGPNVPLRHPFHPLSCSVAPVARPE